MMDVSNEIYGQSLAFFHFRFWYLSLLGLKLVRMQTFCDLVYESMTLRLLHECRLIEL